MLNFQDIPVPFVAGQDRTASEPLIQPPGVVRVTNGEFDDLSNIRVVDGLTATPLSAMTGETAISDTNRSLRRLLAHKDELLIEAWNGVYRQQVGGSFALAAASSNQRRNLLGVQRAGATSVSEAQGTSSDDWSASRRPNAGVLGTDAAVSGDYTCVVWVEQFGTSGVRYQVSWQIRHRVSDAVVGRGRIRDGVSNVVEPRVVAFGGQFRIYAISGGDIGYLFIDPLQTQNVNQAVTKFTVGANYVYLDVALSTLEVCVSATRSLPAVEHWIGLQSAPTALTASSVAIAGAASPLSTLYVDTGGAGVGRAFVSFYVVNASNTTLRWFASSASTYLSLGASSQSVGTPVAWPVTLKTWGGSAAAFPVLLQTLAGSTYNTAAIRCVVYDATSAPPGSMASGLSTYLVLDGFVCASSPVVGPGATYTGTQGSGLLLGAYLSSLAQSLFQVFDIGRSVTAAIAGGQTEAAFSQLRVFDAGAYVAGVWPPVAGLPSAVFTGRVCTPVRVPGESFGVFFWCAKFTPNITNVIDLGQNPTNVQRNTLRWDEDITSIEFADLLYMAGGTPLCYDGQDVFEEGFSYSPEVLTLSASGAGGPLSAGNYLICFVYEWFDGQGNRWQSAPSPAAQLTASAGNTYTATVRPLKGTLKAGVQVIPYRTTALSGTVFYRDSPLGDIPQTDTALQASELLYVGPGSLRFAGTQSNNGLPAVKSFAVHQNRLVAVGGEFERGFFYSKERSLRYPAEFNRVSGFGLLPDSAGRGVTAASVDDKLVFFGELGLAVVFGQGPNFNWLQNDYSQPAFIQAAEGVRYDTPHVGLVPDGVWYMTGSGPRMLTRGLATARGPTGLDMGAQAKTSDGAQLGRCLVVVHPAKPQVLFYEDVTSTLFIYDYMRDQWTTRADIPKPLGRSGLNFARGQLYFLTNDTVANNPLLFSDRANESLLPLTVETGWMTFSGLQRFQRLTDVQVLLSLLNKAMGSAYTVVVSVFTDFDPVTPTQTTTATTDSISSTSQSTQVAHQIVRQQSNAFKFVITVTPLGKGGNFALSGMLARVGTKKGGARLPNSRRA